MKTALDQLKEYWADKEFDKALGMVAKWRRLGAHADAIKDAWDSRNHPKFYKQIGRCPDTLYAKGLLAIAERFELN